MPETPIALSQTTYRHIIDTIGPPGFQERPRSQDHMTNTGIFRLDAATTAATIAAWTSVSASWCYKSATGVSVGTSGWTIYSPFTDVIASGEYVVATRWYGTWLITSAINYCPT